MGGAAKLVDLNYSPPSGWTGPVFALSQDYPTQLPPATSFPWQTIDFKTLPKEYLQAVLDYCYEGSIDNSFVPQKNPVRKWFHAPWMHTGPNAREFVHGLTNERQSRPFELSDMQNTAHNNAAVGFYNDVGGYTIGRVWADPVHPDPTQASFPEGAVSYKLLFTQAPAAKVPFLAGAPEWSADVNRNPQRPSTAAQVENKKVRLLQIDVAVKDRRADPAGGWVFGTFQYDDAVQDASPWRRVTPVGLAWGNDPTLTETQFNAGNAPAESWIPKSVSLVPGGNATEAERLQWFRNLQPGQAFTPGAQSLDFSLQLGVSIQNFAASITPPQDPSRRALLEAAPSAAPVKSFVEELLKDNIDGAAE
ncbi:hypothetical protein WJX72_011656 [[Myrmecia] bisecta]|uniref:Uncharacterized protein n=1 Tax=[Myrmecia] bisecta TaxID=41462 RepID=A0AAW1Q2C0_9CHLO